MAERIEKILLQLDIDVNQLKINLQSAKEKIELLNKQQETARLEMAKLEKQGITSGATYENLARQVLEYDVSLKATTDEARNYTRQLKLIEEANRATQGSMNEQKALLSILTAQYNELSQEERESTEAGRALGTQIRSITDTLKAQEATLGNNRRNVGNYEAAIRAAFDSLNKAKGTVNDTKLAIETLNQKFREGTVSQQGYDTELGVLVTQLAESETETGELSQKLEELKGIVTENGEGFKSLRQQLKEARDEATRAQDQFSAGLIDEKTLIASQKNVANLTERMDDFNKRVEALNPDAKLKAFTQAASGAAGIIGTLSGAMGLFGAQSEDTAAALLKVQQFMQFTQGLNQLTQFAESLDNIRVVLGFTKTATDAATIAQTKSNVTKAGGVVVTEGLAAAEVKATVATRGLSASLATLAGPLTIIALVAAGVLASLNAFGETEFAEQTRDLTLAVKQENDEHQRTITLLTGVNKGRVTDAEALLKQAEAERNLRLAKAGSVTEKETIIQDTRPQIQALEDELLQIKREALAAELRANEEHILKQTVLRDNAQVEVITATKTEAREKAAEALKAAEDEIQAVREKNNDIRNEQEQLENELRVLPQQRLAQIAADEKSFNDRRKEALNQATLLRIGLIKDSQERELAAEREATRQKVDKLLDDEAANAELIIAEKEASHQRILDIIARHALEEVEERNQLAIQLTVEGTEARIDAEIKAQRDRQDELLKNDRLTQTQRQIIVAESEDKIFQLEQKRIALLQQNADDELEVERRKQTALQAIRSQQVSTPDEAFQADRQNIEENFKFQLSELEKNNQRKTEEITAQRDRELQLNIEGATELERNTKEFADKQQKIIEDANKEIIASDEATSAERQKLLLDTGNEIIAITQRRFNAEAEIKILQLQRVEAELNTELAAEREGSNRQIELRRQLESVKTEIARAGMQGRLNFLKFELESGDGLTQAQYEEYLLLLAKMAEAGAVFRTAEEQAQIDTENFLREQSKKLYQDFVNLAIASSQAQTNARLRQVDEVLDAELEALDIKQQKEEGTFVAKTAIEQKYDAQREAAQKKADDQRSRIKKKQFQAEKDAASIEAAIAGAVAFVKALPNYILAGLVAVSTAAEISIIQGQPTPEFSKGGYTGDGDPKGVSYKLGRKPYIYHKGEYVVPHNILKSPEARPHVEALEYLRSNRLSIAPIGWRDSVMVKPSFETGGYTGPSFELQQLQAGLNIDMNQFKDSVVAAVTEGIKAQEPPIVRVRDVNDEQAKIVRVEDRANI